MNWEVIPYSVWRNADGRTASIYGANPLGAGWSVEPAGWTFRNPHTGQTGIGRKPFATESEALAHAATMPRPSTIGYGD